MATLRAPQANTIYFGPTGTEYISNDRHRFTATVAADIRYLQKQGCDVVTTDDTGVTATIALAAGAADGMLITATVKDSEGDTVEAVHALDIWMSDAATGIGLTSDAYSGDLVASTGAILTALTAKKHWRVVTAATGIFAATLTDTANPADQYVAMRAPSGAGVVVSAASGTSWGA